jgi:hypothetical protein
LKLYFQRPKPLTLRAFLHTIWSWEPPSTRGNIVIQRPCLFLVMPVEPLPHALPTLQDNTSPSPTEDALAPKAYNNCLEAELYCLEHSPDRLPLVRLLGWMLFHAPSLVCRELLAREIFDMPPLPHNQHVIVLGQLYVEHYIQICE